MLYASFVNEDNAFYKYQLIHNTTIVCDNTVSVINQSHCAHSSYKFNWCYSCASRLVKLSQLRLNTYEKCLFL